MFALKKTVRLKCNACLTCVKYILTSSLFTGQLVHRHVPAWTDLYRLAAKVRRRTAQPRSQGPSARWPCGAGCIPCRAWNSWKLSGTPGPSISNRTAAQNSRNSEFLQNFQSFVDLSLNSLEFAWHSSKLHSELVQQASKFTNTHTFSTIYGQFNSNFQIFWGLR